jgi:RNA polymerase sigma factor (sigma-70 family)
MATYDTLDGWVEQALGGSREALDALVRAIQDDVYGLALRMLWHPADAADATQEILIKIVTHLASFRGESAFRTWCFRIACNHLLTARAGRIERRAVSFEELHEEFAAREGALEAGGGPEDRLLAEEVKLGCTLGILQCLDRPHRLAYVIGEILELSGDEGAEVSGIEPAAFRKRLSRARERIRGFVGERCGIVNEAARCRCAGRIGAAREAGMLDPDRLLFARHEERPLDASRLLPKVRELEALHAEVALYRSHPDYAAPPSIARSVRDLLAIRPPSVLTD